VVRRADPARDGSASVRPGPSALAAALTPKGRRITIVYSSERAIARDLDRLTRGSTNEQPTYLALDGDVVVSASGTKGALDERFLADLLAGLRARVERFPRAP
jgi:hypothetical protein